MADKKKGWVPIYRDIRNHWIWNCERYSKAQAWIDLLLAASHSNHEFYFNGAIKREKPGQFWTSIRQLALRWQWSKGTVTKFLDLLVSDGMIQYDSRTHFGTLVTIVKWEDFNFDQSEGWDNDKDNDKDNVRTPRGHRVGHKEGHKSAIHNNGYNNGYNNGEIIDNNGYKKKKELPPLDYNPEVWQ